MPTSRKKPSRRESSVAVPTVVTSRARDMKPVASAAILAGWAAPSHPSHLSRGTIGIAAAIAATSTHSRCQRGRARYRARAFRHWNATLHDIRYAGVAFEPLPASEGPSTARCDVLVSPDGERTMNTYRAAAQDLHPRDIDPEAIAAAAITYLEGYPWDPKHAKDAFLKAAAAA